MPPLPVRVKSLTLSPYCVMPQSSPLMPTLIVAGAAQAGAARGAAATSMAAARKNTRQVIFASTFAGASLVAPRSKRKLGSPTARWAKSLHVMLGGLAAADVAANVGCMVPAPRCVGRNKVSARGLAHDARALSEMRH